MKSKSMLTQLHKCLLVMGLLLCGTTVFAQSISITNIATVDVDCGNNGSITITATGSNLRYELIVPSAKTMALQSSNVFSGLPAGLYTIAIYDDGVNNHTPVTTTRTISGSYTPMTIDVVGSTTSVSSLCAVNGRITAVLAGGNPKPSFTYQLLNASNVVVATQTSALRTINFDNLASGTYRVRTTDCGNTITSGPVTLSVVVPPFSSGTALGVVGGTLQTTNTAIAIYSATAVCETLTLYFSSITVGGQNIFQYPGLRYRVLFSGTYSAWYTVPSAGTAPYVVTVGGFDMTKAQNFQVEVEHPCTSATRLSSAIAFSIARARIVFLYADPLFNSCTGLIDSVRYTPGVQGGNLYSCSPYTVTMVIDSKTYTVSSTSTSPYFASGKAFTVTKVTDGTGADITSYVERATTTFGGTSQYPAPVPLLNQIGVSTSAFVPPTCDFTKGQVVFKPNLYMSHTVSERTTIGGSNGATNWSYTLDSEGYIDNSTFTITLTGGPDFASFAPKVITIAKGTPLFNTTEYPLWNNLSPASTYTYKVDIVRNGIPCTSITGKTFTFALDYTSFTPATPVLNGLCGAYTIVGNATLAGPAAATTKYKMQVWRSNGTLLGEVSALSGVAVSYSSLSLIPGDYIIKYVVTDAKGNSCTKGNYPITRPVFQGIVEDAKLSGGLSCTAAATGVLTVIATNGEGQLKYRIKVKGAADNTYTPTVPQTSNIFTVPKAVMHTVEITDLCGTYYADMMVQDGSQQFLTVKGPVAPGIVCIGGQVVFGAYSIGTIKSYQWYKDGVKIDGATGIDYTVPAANASTIGTYRVDVVNGSNCPMSSSYTITTISDPVPAPVIVGINKICTAGTSVTLEASSTVVAGTYYWYLNNVEVYVGPSKYYTTSTIGTYNVLVAPVGACASVKSNDFNLTLGTPTAPLVPTGVSPVCASGTTLVSNPALSGVTYTWYKGGVQVQQSASNSFFATSSGNYTVSVSPIAGCVSAQSPAFALTVHSAVTSNIASTNVTCFGANDGRITVTPLTGTAPYQYSKDGGVTWQATNAFTSLTPGNYNVQMKDANNCLTTIVPITIAQPAIIILTAPPTNVTCFGGNSGAINVSATGGSGTYQYQLNGGAWQASGVFSGLISGTYTLAVRDAVHNSCTKSTTVTITQPAELLLPVNISAPLACPNLPATITIANSISGATYRVYDAATGGTLQGSGTSIGGSLIINVLTYPANTTLYVEVTSGPCTSTRKAIAIEVRPTLANYPDIRLQVCPTPSRTLNLSRFVDTTDYQSASLSWLAVSPQSPIPSADAEGNIETADLTATGTHVYTYSIANTCYTTPQTRKVYLLPMANKQVGKQVDTVAICRDFATGINLRQILGLAAGGTWNYDANIAPFVRKASTYPFSNALILEGDKAYTDPALQAPAYKKRYKTDANAIHLDFIYTTTGTDSCLGAGTRRLVVVITSTIL